MVYEDEMLILSSLAVSFSNCQCTVNALITAETVIGASAAAEILNQISAMDEITIRKLSTWNQIIPDMTSSDCITFRTERGGAEWQRISYRRIEEVDELYVTEQKLLWLRQTMMRADS